MKKIMNLAFFALIATSFYLTSCQKDTVTEPASPIVTDNSAIIRSLSEATADSIGCYNFVYPLDGVTNDGTIVILTNSDEFLTLVNSGTLFDLVYPFRVRKQTDGSELVIENVDDIKKTVEDCK
jgi:hypothetical protein